MISTMLDQPLQEFSRALIDLRQEEKLERNPHLTKLPSLLNLCRDSFHETSQFQQKLLQQLQQFDTALADLSRILRFNYEERLQLEQVVDEEDLDRRAQLMALNAEALECRAAAVQLQQQAKMVLNKALEMEQRANAHLTQPNATMRLSPSLSARTKTPDLDPSRRSAEPIVRESPIERMIVLAKDLPKEEEYNGWPVREFMQDDGNPQCIVRLPPSSLSVQIEVSYVPVTETEYLLDKQEELIGTPVHVRFDPKNIDQPFIILALPFVNKRTTHREHVIKLRQSNGIWMAVDTTEALFDMHKEKRFLQCPLYETSICAVVSRLRRDRIVIQKGSSGRFLSVADARFTIQWPKNATQANFPIDACLQPVDVSLFTQFCRNYSHDCQGLLAVGPIIEMLFEDIPLLKPLQFTLPILVPPKKKSAPVKSTTNESNPSASTATTTAEPPSQQAILQAMLEQEEGHERLILLYNGGHDHHWHIDTNVLLMDSKMHDTITTEMQTLHPRIIVARYNKQFMSTKQLPVAIGLLEQMLHQRAMSVFLRRRLDNPAQLCFACCASQVREMIDNDLQKENYPTEEEQTKEIIIQEGQLLEIRFRGNVQPSSTQQRLVPFAFNTHFPFYFETQIEVLDRYAQHLSHYFYGFLQVFTKATTNRSGTETELCLVELILRLPKPLVEARLPTQKALATFTGEGILTPALFRDLATSLSNDEWRRLARRLGMTRIRIEAIEHDYHADAPYYMLLAWFKRVSRAADKIQLLINGLKLVNRKDLAQDLQSIRDDKRCEQQTISKEEQLRILAVAFNRICQRDECLRIWKQLARELSLTNENIHEIEQNYSSRQERCLRCLEHWAFNEIRADVLCLAKIIRSLGFKSLARELEDLV